MNTFGLNEYIIVVGDDVYELQGYAHDLAAFMWELSQELGYNGFYKKDVHVYTL